MTEIEKQHRQSLKKIYGQWPKVRRYLQLWGCDSITAEDLFQEALLIYIRKLETGLQLDVEPIYYVRNTARLLWMNQARKQGKHIQVPLGEQQPETEDNEWLQKEEKLKRVEEALQGLGEQCRKLLEYFYGLGMSMVDIAKKIGLRNDKVAKAQKYKCLQKAKELVLLQKNDVEFQ